MSEQGRLSDDPPLPRDRIFPIVRGFFITSLIAGMVIVIRFLESGGGKIGASGVAVLLPLLALPMALVASVYPACVLFGLLVFVYAPLWALGWLTCGRFVAASVSLATIVHVTVWLTSFQPRIAHATMWAYVSERAFIAGALAGVFWATSQPSSTPEPPPMDERSRIDAARKLAAVLKAAGFSKAQVIERLEADGVERPVAVAIVASARRED